MDTTVETPSQSRSQVTPERRGRVGVAFFSFILIGMSDGAVGVLLPSIIAFYAIDKATASLLFPSSTLGYLIAAFNSGLLLERLGRRVFLMLGAAAFALGTLLVFLTPPFPLLLPAMLGVGFGLAILDAGFNAYIAGLPGSTRLLNYLHAFYGGGALLGPLVASSILALALGWNVTYLIWAVIGSVTLIAFSLLFKGKRPQRARGAVASHMGEATGEAGNSSSLSSNPLAATLRSGIVWLSALFLLIYVGTEVTIGSWSYSLLTEERHQPVVQSGWMVSGYWFGLTVGRIVLGHLAERLGGRRTIQFCLGGVLVGIALIWAAPAGIVAALGLWLTGFSLGPIFPTTIALIGGIVPERLRQSAIGFIASLGSMGAAAYPWIAGNVAQHLGLWALLPFVAVLTLAMLGVWLALQRRAQVHATPAIEAKR